MTTQADSEQRAAALDPTASFIVEAPAGSGKTELLTRRLLRLLSSVELPEQIVAITFTRKAAAEMRQRVTDTLRAAASESESESLTAADHRRESLALGRAALKRSAERGWSILEQPQRLRILTIDALNAGLARQLPILTSGITSVAVTDNADGLYRLAARRTTESLGDDGPLGDALRHLLGMADNALTRLEAWLAGTLSGRDRWLRLIDTGEERSLPTVIEANLLRLRQRAIDAIRRLVGAAAEQHLLELLRQREAVTGTDPLNADSTATAWEAATAFLLTATGAWRQRFTRKEGFPPDRPELRATLNELLASFAAMPGLREKLTALSQLPQPKLSDAQHDTLLALIPVLQRLLAELRIVFAEGQSVDHTELALAAQQALGAVDAPSDLLLALDRRIEHILVDEFQDTSHLQWGLLERLTAGWEAGDGRTLFLVGDPMQSIYRFRDADLSLFLRAQQQGIGEVRLRHIQLSMNFRSAAQLVDWVNSAFAPVFPSGDATAPGGPAFRVATAARGSDQHATVAIDAIPGGDYAAEISRVVTIVKRETQAHPQQSIGILVRSRSHLAGLRAALAVEGLSAHAVEIDSLTDTQLGLDLLALTQALLHEGDRLAWLGLLRGPCCGFGWQDLNALCGDERKRTIRDLLADKERLLLLSESAQQRAHWLNERLATGFALRATRELAQWVRDCWLLIDGPAALSSVAELERAERFFCALGEFARYGDVDDPAALLASFGKPSGAEVPTESGIEIMTIHRAKGLEFDTVILPGLGRITRGSDSKLLLCNDINLENGQQLSLIAAPAAREDPLFKYLQQLDREQEAAERARLFYVAATRARQRLYLIGAMDARGEQPATGSLLATLWAGIGAGLTVGGDATGNPNPADLPAAIEVPLRQLEFPTHLPEPDIRPPDSALRTGARPEFEWVHPASVQVGTLIHRELQRLTEQAAAAGKPMAPTIEPRRFARELALLGVEAADLTEAAQRVAAALARAWEDPVGQWIFKPWPEAWSELRLTLRQHDRLEHIQLDRSFVDEQGVRWIIDYKTGRHLGADVEGFLDSEVERYRDQLERYAQAVAVLDSRPLRVGLYFPLMAALRDWVPSSLAPR